MAVNKCKNKINSVNISYVHKTEQYFGNFYEFNNSKLYTLQLLYTTVNYVLNSNNMQAFHTNTLSITLAGYSNFNCALKTMKHKKFETYSGLIYCNGCLGVLNKRIIVLFIRIQYLLNVFFLRVLTNISAVSVSNSEGHFS